MVLKNENLQDVVDMERCPPEVCKLYCLLMRDTREVVCVTTELYSAKSNKTAVESENCFKPDSIFINWTVACLQL